MAGLIRSSRELHHAGKSLLHEAAGMGEGEDGLEQGTEEGVTPAPGFHQAAFITRGLQLLALGGQAPRTDCQLLPCLRAGSQGQISTWQAGCCLLRKLPEPRGTLLHPLTLPAQAVRTRGSQKGWDLGFP